MSGDARRGGTGCGGCGGAGHRIAGRGRAGRKSVGLGGILGTSLGGSLLLEHSRSPVVPFSEALGRTHKR